MKIFYLIFGVLLTPSITCFGKGFAENQSIVCLQTDFSNGKPKIGTGFLISPTLIATAEHQVKDSGAVVANITVFLQDDRPIKARLPAVAQGEGLAILALPEPIGNDYMLLQDNAPDVDAEVSAVGCQKDRSRLTRQGKIMPLPEKNGFQRDEITDLISLNLPIKVGFSGGPLLMLNGNVAGIIYGFNELEENLSYAIPSNKILQIMADQKVPEYGKTLFHQGIRAFSLKQYTIAKKYFELATQNQPNYFEAYTSLGMTLFKLRQFSEARDALLGAVLINSDYPLAYYHLAGVYREGLSDHLSARNAYRRYLELDPDSTDASQIRGWLKEVERSSQKETIPH